MASNGRKTQSSGKKNKIVKFKVKTSWKNILLYGFLIVIALILIGAFSSPYDDAKSVSVSDIISEVKKSNVTQITVDGDKLTATEKNGNKINAYKEPSADVYSLFNNAGASLKDKNVKVTVKDLSAMSGWVNLVGAVLPVLLMVGFFYFIFRQARGTQESIFSFGQSKAKLYNKDTPKVSFNDVAGVDEAKQELSEIVDFLRNPQKYKSMGARTPKGVLMIGPAGTGKTLLARATAGEANVAFFSMAGSEFMEMLVGVGASRVRDLFNTAKKAQPAIIFIDEIDAIGRQRGNGLMGGHDEREQTLNQILVEMDGFTQNEQIIVMAATNRPDVLDPALVRPGRFDRRVSLELPDVEGRKEILLIHAKNKPFIKEVNWDKVAKRTVGFSGADLENMLNEAAILAARLNKKAIDMADLEEAATKVKIGPEKKRLQSEEDRRMTAYHEAGHALVSWEMPHMDPVHRISIVSRGMTLGHTMMENIDRVHETKTRLIEQIAVMMGGRAAEDMIFGEITTGASNDIEKATQVARAMVMKFGMSDLGPQTLDLEPRSPYEQDELSDDMKAKVDEEVTKIIDAGYKTAVKVITDLRPKLDAIAEQLLKVETLDADDFTKLVGPKVAPVKIKA
ncbi:ATP-dependent zinc metalloprotease FtsH [soil metagenome]